MNITKSTESKHSLIKKLFIFGTVSIGIFIVGKRHIAYQKQHRHELESDSSTVHSYDENEFGYVSKRRGFPLQNPNLDYNSADRKSKFQGAGDAYQTRRQGDRLSMYQVLKMKWFAESDEEKKYYKPGREDKFEK
ncbi:hypothetical protein SBY92_000155 [Candida maltosa Xu316]